MNILMEHGLSITAGVFLLCMVLYGHHRGFLRLAVTFSALILSLLAVHVAMPKITGYIQENTEIHKTIGRGLLKAAGAELFADDANGSSVPILPDIQIPAQQREIIEKLKVPQQIKEVLLENNNREIYKILKVEEFFDYVGTYLAGMLLNLVGSVLLFLLVYIGLRILIRWLDLLARLPIISGINQIAGALLGGIQGMLALWLFFLIVRICAEMPWTAGILSQIHKSVWLSFLYSNNFFNWIFIKLLSSFL
ncbi:MAG: CvpA family protein [Brotaphodocola sp.]